MVEYIPGGRDGSTCDCCHGSSASSPPPSSPAPPPPFTDTGCHRRRTLNRKLLRVAGDAGRDGARPKCLRARAHIMSQGAGAYQCAAHSRRCEGRHKRQKDGDQRSHWHSQQECVFIGSDLDGPIGSDLDGSFLNGLVLGFHGGDAGNSTSMSSG